MIPFLKDISSLIDGYDIERLDMSGISDAVQILKEWGNFCDGNSKYTFAGLTARSIKGLSKLTGIPFSSISRTFENSAKAVNNAVSDVFGIDTTAVEYAVTSAIYSAGEKNKSKYIELIVNARLNGDDDLANKIRNKLIFAGLNYESIDRSIKNKMVDILIENPTMQSLYEASEKHDYESINRYVSKLKGQNFTEEEIKTALNSLKKSMSNDNDSDDNTNDIGEYEGKDVTIYSYEDLAYAFIYNSDEYDNIRAEIIRTSSAKDPEKNADTQLKNKLKAIYKSSFNNNEQLRKKTWKALKKLGLSDEDIINITKKSK